MPGAEESVVINKNSALSVPGIVLRFHTRLTLLSLVSTVTQGVFMQKMKLNLRSISAAVSGALLVALVLGIGSSLWAQDANPLTLDAPLAFDTPTYSSPIAKTCFGLSTPTTTP